MRAETPIYYNDEVWQCVYLNGNSRVNRETRDELLWNIVDMYHTGKQKRRVNTNNFEGLLEAKSRKYLVNFSGTHFLIEGELEGGKIRIGVLLLDRFNPELN